jgi:hypothetical protein
VRDQRESSASACASRNSGPSITPLCGEACLAALAFTMLIPSQRIITKDNVSIDIAAAAYYHICPIPKGQ